MMRHHSGKAARMALGIERNFTYDVVLGRTQSGTWSGRAEPSPDSRWPGLGGQCPEIGLRNGSVRIQSTEYENRDALSNQANGCGRLPWLITFHVGDLLQRVVLDGDVFQVRGDSGAHLAVALFRDRQLVMGIGSLGSHPCSGIALCDDPRAHEMGLPYVVESLEKPDAMLVWLDAADNDINIEATLASIADAVSGKTVIVAIKADDPARGADLNRRAFQTLHGASSISCEMVDSRFFQLPGMARIRPSRPEDQAA
jgi:hypothetical protein